MISEQRVREIANEGRLKATRGGIEKMTIAAELLAARAEFEAQLTAGRALYEAVQKLMAENERLAKQRDELLTILNEAFDRAIAAEQPKPAGGGA